MAEEFRPAAPPPDEPVVMKVLFDWGHTRTTVDFRSTLPCDHARHLRDLARVLEGDDSVVFDPEKV